MKLTVNGRLHEHDGSGSISALLEELEAVKAHAAVMVNGEVVPAAEWNTAVLSENDEIEMLVFPAIAYVTTGTGRPVGLYTDTEIVDDIALADAYGLFVTAYPDCLPLPEENRLTGRYGRRTGVGGVIATREPAFALPLDEVTLPEVVAAASTPWATSMVGKWPLANLDSPDWLEHPLASGFQWAAGSPSTSWRTKTWFAAWPNGF